MGQEQSISEAKIDQQQDPQRRFVSEKIARSIGVDFSEVVSLSEFLFRNGYILSEAEIGKGISASVFSGETNDRQHVAIKLVRCIKPGRDESAIREFNILKHIHSDHVVKAFDLLQYESQKTNILITIMELCQYNLSIELRENKKRMDLMSICLQLSQGLKDIHCKDILHLDIKPSNIMLGKDNKWKFIDMEISMLLQEHHFISSANIIHLYSSPEQFRSYNNVTNNSQKQMISKSSDIYSLGLVFAELTGGLSDKYLVMQHRQGKEVNEQLLLNPQYEQFNKRVIQRMIAQNPAERITIQEVENELKQLAQESLLINLNQINSQQPQSRWISQSSSQQSNNNMSFSPQSQNASNKSYSISHMLTSSQQQKRNQFSTQQILQQNGAQQQFQQIQIPNQYIQQQQYS